MMKRDINWYCTRAQENGGYSSYRKLSSALGISQNAITQFRKGRIFPSDATMMKLASIAEIDPAIALIDLNMWRSPEEARKTYAKILQKITAAIALAVGLNVLTSSSAMAFTGVVAVPSALPLCQVLGAVLYITENSGFC